MNINPKEPAFPSRPDDNVADLGLSKREYFIAMAFQGLLTKYNLKTPEDQEIVAKLSIELADTLIREVNKQYYDDLRSNSR